MVSSYSGYACEVHSRDWCSEGWLMTVMIANAGIGPPVDFLDTTTKTMDDLWEINIRGVMYCYQAAARQMIKQGGGGKLIGES